MRKYTQSKKLTLWKLLSGKDFIFLVTARETVTKKLSPPEKN